MRTHVPDDNLPAVQSKPPATLGGIAGTGFLPGVSGHPGGRKRSLERRVRELVGDDGDKVASFLVAVLNGEELDSQKPKMSDRLEAARILLERGWGKAPIHVATDGEPTKFVLASAFVVAEREAE
jgi:hypothetical protein